MTHLLEADPPTVLRSRVEQTVADGAGRVRAAASRAKASVLGRMAAEAQRKGGVSFSLPLHEMGLCATKR